MQSEAQLPAIDAAAWFELVNKSMTAAGASALGLPGGMTPHQASSPKFIFRINLAGKVLTSSISTTQLQMQAQMLAMISMMPTLAMAPGMLPILPVTTGGGTPAAADKPLGTKRVSETTGNSEDEETEISNKKTKPSSSNPKNDNEQEAALALLASAAAVKNEQKPAVEQQVSLDNPIPSNMEAWINAQVAVAAAAANAIPPSSIEEDINIEGLDEKEIKKLRRKQSNRESARRSRLRKQAECELLAEENKQLKVQLQVLRGEHMQLISKVQSLEAELNIIKGVQNTQEKQADDTDKTEPLKEEKRN